MILSAIHHTVIRSRMFCTRRRRRNAWVVRHNTGYEIFHHSLSLKCVRMSTIDYIMVRRDEIRTIKDCKVIPGEYVATQHRLVVMEMNVEMTRKPRPRIKQKTKWRNLQKDEFKLTVVPKALEILASVTPEMNYEKLESNLLQLAKE